MLAWQHWQEAIRHLGFFAAAGLLAALAGLLNGVLGAANGLFVGRHRGGWPVEFVPLLLLLVWAWDRGNPKLGFTLLVGLIPVAFVLAGGFLGQAIGMRGPGNRSA
jgi:hypothetical protein